MICADCGKDVLGYTAMGIRSPVEHDCPSRKHPWQVRAEKAEARVAELKDAHTFATRSLEIACERAETAEAKVSLLEGRVKHLEAMYENLLREHDSWASIARARREELGRMEAARSKDFARIEDLEAIVRQFLDVTGMPMGPRVDAVLDRARAAMSTASVCTAQTDVGQTPEVSEGARDKRAGHKPEHAGLNPAQGSAQRFVVTKPRTKYRSCPDCGAFCDCPRASDASAANEREMTDEEYYAFAARVGGRSAPRANEARIGCVKCGQKDDRLDPDTGACYACFDAREPVYIRDPKGTGMLARFPPSKATRRDPTACPKCGDAQPYGPPRDGIACARCHYEPRTDNPMCSQCGATPAPYVENRCMLHYGGQTVQVSETASAVDWKAEAMKLRKVILKPAECPRPAECDDYACDVNRTVRAALERFDAMVTGGEP